MYIDDVYLSVVEISCLVFHSSVNPFLSRLFFATGTERPFDCTTYFENSQRYKAAVEAFCVPENTVKCQVIQTTIGRTVYFEFACLCKPGYKLPDCSYGKNNSIGYV